ncbi:PAS domain-containing protein [Haloarchaeobius sp. TZWWS8]|uniref:PAS domain-containing protein n=1 Tax=Haloarchaeobius sp. TZWWS8 TaxID=3446121 RepID=UPI003EBECAB7
MTTRTTVLLVDGDPELRGQLTAFLEDEGDRFECLEAESVRGALDRYGCDAVDCIVSAYELPDESGLSLVRAVRDRDQYVPFVMFAEDGSEAVASEAIRAGVTDYVTRNRLDSFEHLRGRIEDALEQYRTERSLRETRGRLERLHRSAVSIASATDADLAIERALTAASQILDFDVCGIYTVEDGVFVPVTDQSYVPDNPLPSIDEGVLGKTYREGVSYLVDDTATDSSASPDRESFRSAVSIPIDGFGVFQAISERPAAFSEADRELAELLVTHLAQTLDRLESDRHLRQTNEQLQAILDNTTANIYIKGLDGEYELVNDRFSKALGRPKTEILGKTDEELQPSEHAERLRENDRLAIERREPVEVEEDAEFCGESRVYYSVKVPLYDDSAEPVGVCGISTDITELKEREDELERQKARLDEFARLVSHDLKSPLAVAQGYLGLVEEDVEHENIDEVKRAHERIEDIIDGLLHLARQGRQIGDRDPVRLDVLARTAWTTVDTRYATLETESAAVIDADVDRLQQAFENLFRNSIEHGRAAEQVPVGEDGSADASRPLTVRVGVLRESSAPAQQTTHDDEAAVRGFYVEDDGTGFDDATQENAFELGVTSSNTGTGFGLAIVQKIVEAHGWSISSTEGSTGGARFEVEF